MIEEVEEQLHPKFWEFVETVQWNEKRDRSPEWILECASLKFSYEEFVIFRGNYDFLSQYLHNLDHIWLGNDVDIPSLGVSDDGWWDVRAQVIGNGGNCFYSVFEDHEALRAVAEDYTENFGYLFHITNSNSGRYTSEEFETIWRRTHRNTILNQI